MKGKRKSTITCSKRIILVSNVISTLLTILVLIAYFFTEKDVTPLVTLTGIAYGETTAAHTFYFWKAKAENKIKLTQNMAETWADKYGIDTVVNLANITLSD